MTDYTKTTNFSVKDTLVTGDPAKIIRGAEFDTEFNALQVSIATKANIASPSFTGDVNITGGNFIGSLVGDLTGNVTGDLTGNVVGNVTGDLTGTADDSNRLGGISASNYLLSNSDSFGSLSGLNLTIANDIELGRRLEHRGDPDTYFEFSNNNLISLVTGGSTRIQVSTSSVTTTLPLNANSGITGDLTGNVTGNVVGNVTGDLTGNSVTTDEVNLDAGYGSQAPIFGVRAWGDVSSTGSLLAGGNISSVTQTSIGTYSIQFSSPMPDSNYAVTATLNKTASDETVAVTAKNTTGFIVQCFDVSLGGRENNSFMFTVVR